MHRFCLHTHPSNLDFSCVSWPVCICMVPQTSQMNYCYSSIVRWPVPLSGKVFTFEVKSQISWTYFSGTDTLGLLGCLKWHQKPTQSPKHHFRLPTTSLVGHDSSLSHHCICHLFADNSDIPGQLSSNFFIVYLISKKVLSNICLFIYLLKYIHALLY